MNYKVIVDPTYGYRRLDPIPDSREVSNFYQNLYYNMIHQGRRAPGLHRLMAGGEEAKWELKWLHSTLFADITDVLCRYAPNQQVLDIGCGTGEFASYLKDNGFSPVCIDPAPEAANYTRSRGLETYNLTLEEFAEEHEQKDFGVVAMVNVLKHIPDPVAFINIAKELLAKPNGILCIRTPNDFNPLQLVAQQKLGKDEWWVVTPDHINYFNFQSLSYLLESLGFEILEVQSDFPTEIFLLMGDDHIGHPDVGHSCHKRRVSFEMNAPVEIRRSMYRDFAKIGIGRGCLIFCKLREEN